MRKKEQDQDQDQLQLPMQPVENPILCSPYEEPSLHWVYDTNTGEAIKQSGRRPAGYFYKTVRTGSQQLSLLREEEWDDLPLVKKLRSDVKRWREANYRNATNVTRNLLRHWSSSNRERPLFFCQREAVETIIYIAEIRRANKRLRFRPEVTDEDLRLLIDQPNNSDLSSLIRYGCKMATGSGKTVVMAMLIAWSFCNRGKVRWDDRFPSAVLAVAPNLTIKRRLEVLRPENAENYYDRFELVPHKYRSLLNSGKVKITNWHQFATLSPQHENGGTYKVVDKGDETPETFAKRILGDLYGHGEIMVLNDEGHHAYRPKSTSDQLSSDEKSDRELATVWVRGLDLINAGCGLRFCVDLSATPFYIDGSGHSAGTPFPWLVSDFGLVDAIESGITKIPRLPVSDTTGRPEPKYFRLWNEINKRIHASERRGKKPKPEVIYREAEDALLTLASQWKQRFDQIQDASDHQEKIPNAMIVVCNNTDIAEYFHQKISGEEIGEVIDPDRKKKKAEMKTIYGKSRVLPEFSNRETELRTLRIDSKKLQKAESDGGSDRSAETLREMVATVGKIGEIGEQIRCIVSVAMLNEGWDANNVTHILGLRAFTSQLLCEQVVGRGLRRMDYTPDPETGLLTEEYVDVYGIPFSVIPFKGRPTGQIEPEDRPKNYVRALPERSDLEMRFPNVEGYAFALKHNEITADIDAMEDLILEPDLNPTSTFVKPQAGYQTGTPSAGGPGRFELHDRQAFYKTQHFQTIKFEITRQIVLALVGDGKIAPDPRGNPYLRFISRHRLFPQVYALVDRYIDRKVDFRDCHPCEIGLERYVLRIIEHMLIAIQPNEVKGETPLLPLLNRLNPISSSKDVEFKTVRRCVATEKSHINLVVLDSDHWEASAVHALESSSDVAFYVRNDHLGLGILYDYQRVNHIYEPDFLIRLTNGTTLILEIKGFETDQDRAKHEMAKKWISAVNHWRQLGKWSFEVCRDPQRLSNLLRANNQS